MTRVRPGDYDPTADYYRLLGLRSSASADDIRQAFRKRAKEVHPDLNRDRSEWATQEFQRLNQAQQILTDPVRRRQYDFQRHAYRAVFGRSGRDRRSTSHTLRDSRDDGTGPRTRPRQSNPYRKYSDRVRSETSYASHPPQPAQTQTRWVYYFVIFLAILFVRALSSSGGSLSSPYNGASVRSTVDALYGSNIGSSASNLATFDAPVTCTSGNAQITYPPATDKIYIQPFEVRGIALAADFESYSLLLIPESEYSTQTWLTPEAWSYAVNRRPEPRYDVLAGSEELAPFLTRSGLYRLRLVVNSRTGLALTCDRLVAVALPGNQ